MRVNCALGLCARFRTELQHYACEVLEEPPPARHDPECYSARSTCLIAPAVFADNR